MKLNELFSKAPGIEIKSLSNDSRLENEDGIFFCLEGRRHDGHNHIDEALKNGAKVVVYSRDIELKSDAIYIKVDDVVKVMNKVALKFYGDPAFDMNTIVTIGDYGKTSITSLLRHLFSNFKKSGALGSYGVIYSDKHYQMRINTNPLEYLEALKKMKEEGVLEALVELDGYFLKEAPFDIFNTRVLIYTGHDESGNDDLESYKKMIDFLGFDSYVIANGDDPNLSYLLSDTKAKVLTYGFSTGCDFEIKDLHFERKNSQFILKHTNKNYQINTNLFPHFNIANLVAALGALVLFGYEIDKLIPFLKNLWPLNGRCYKLDLGQEYEVIVDFARNEKALKDLYRYASAITSSHDSIITLFGIAGGKGERKMAALAKLALDYCDKIILTEEDPRQEDPQELCEMIAKHISGKEYIIVSARLNAIEEGIALLNSKDTLLILGKGDENFMYRTFGKENYQGDANIALNFIKKRLEEEKSEII